ncbi:hypothetical protein BS50DRAFT_583080 [Corynespora cassiicola Philippines]|uniref:Uncharacterized protein n=1 Tax=Corynespora cassiicola Philippines TaxID=1448308 RepID=A0A2T2P7B6_CORCC|nr:hypothetical protein BS50DRAFT_583080 [Corynespora cassiicola Philippines]
MAAAARERCWSGDARPEKETKGTGLSTPGHMDRARVCSRSLPPHRRGQASPLESGNGGAKSKVSRAPDAVTPRAHTTIATAMGNRPSLQRASPVENPRSVGMPSPQKDRCRPVDTKFCQPQKATIVAEAVYEAPSTWPHPTLEPDPSREPHLARPGGPGPARLCCDEPNPRSTIHPPVPNFAHLDRRCSVICPHPFPSEPNLKTAGSAGLASGRAE